MKRRIGWPLRYGVALACIVALAGAGVGCRSMSKERLGEELAALEKNAAPDPLRRNQLNLEVDGEVRDFELVSRHAAARDADPDRLPVVLVHGTPSTLFSWTELTYGDAAQEFSGLAADRDVWAIEVIGHGIAPGDAAPYGFERCARFVNAAIAALGLERVHLVGSSYGGEFAWRAALNDPGRIASLVLLDSSGYERRDEDWLPEEIEMRENSLAKLGWLLNSPERIRTALTPHFDEIPPGRVEEFHLVCANSANWKAMVDLACDENGDREAEIQSIEAPTLVLWGADDCAYSLEVYGERFARDIPNAQLVPLPDTGHYPHEQHPARVAAELRRFFSEVESNP